MIFSHCLTFKQRHIIPFKFFSSILVNFNITRVNLFTNIMFNCYLFSDVFCGTLHCQNGLDKPIVDGGVTHINMQVQLSLSFEVAYL